MYLLFCSKRLTTSQWNFQFCIKLFYLQTFHINVKHFFSNSYLKIYLSYLLFVILLYFDIMFLLYVRLDKPKIVDTPTTIVNESDRAILSREIVSNPLSNVSWYDGSELLSIQKTVTTATFTIGKAMCTDTRNFTLIASNTVERNVSALVEFIVNCKWVFFQKINQTYVNSLFNKQLLSDDALNTVNSIYRNSSGIE